MLFTIGHLLTSRPDTSTCDRSELLGAAHPGLICVTSAGPLTPPGCVQVLQVLSLLQVWVGPVPPGVLLVVVTPTPPLLGITPSSPTNPIASPPGDKAFRFQPPPPGTPHTHVYTSLLELRLLWRSGGAATGVALICS